MEAEDDAPFLVEFAKSITAKVFVPGDWVPPDNLYIIHRGLCLYRATVLCKGRVFGEDYILESDRIKDTSCARAINYLEVFASAREDVLGAHTAIRTHGFLQALLWPTPRLYSLRIPSACHVRSPCPLSTLHVRHFCSRREAAYTIPLLLAPYPDTRLSCLSLHAAAIGERYPKTMKKVRKKVLFRTMRKAIVRDKDILIDSLSTFRGRISGASNCRSLSSAFCSLRL